MHNISQSSDELLQVFDEAGNPTGSLPRSIVKVKPYQYWHAVANIWLINTLGEILCTKRSPMLKNKANLWQSYIGGHLKAGQSFIEAAVAEAEEEVGLHINPKQLFLVRKESRQEYLCHFESYIYPFNGGIEDLAFHDGEIVDARWMSLNEYRKESIKESEKWCNSIHPEHEAIIRAWLSDHTNP